MPFRFRMASSSIIAFCSGSCPEEESLPHRRRGLAGFSLLADRSMLMRSRVCGARQTRRFDCIIYAAITHAAHLIPHSNHWKTNGHQASGAH